MKYLLLLAAFCIGESVAQTTYIDDKGKPVGYNQPVGGSITAYTDDKGRPVLYATPQLPSQVMQPEKKDEGYPPLLPTFLLFPSTPVIGGF